jgi:hypothetical protein
MILGRVTLNWFGGSAAISASILRAVAVSTSSPMSNITADTPHLYQIAAGQYFLNARFDLLFSLMYFVFEISTSVLQHLQCHYAIVGR